MITGLAAAGYLAMLAWLFVRRQFLLVMLAVLVVGFTARFTSVVYLDLAGPVYSVQLFRDIGGGSATIALLAAYLTYFSAFLLVFGPATVRDLVAKADTLFVQGPTPTDRRVATGIFWLYVAFVGLLFVDMLRIGVIPLFAGLERFEYTERYGGIWHRLLMNYGMLLALPLGAFYSLGLFFRKRGDNRFLILLIGIFVYLFFAGHRFSAFYSHGTVFVMPYAAVVCWQQCSQRLSVAERRRQLASARLVQTGAAIVMVALIGSAVYKSYYVTRDAGSGNPLESLTHRVFVQQGELWYATWERVVQGRVYDPARAVVGLLINPVVSADRNTTLPYLMVTEIGETAYTTLEAGSTYSGGFPEVLFELFGPIAAFPVVFIVALSTAGLMRVLLRALVERRYVRLVLCWYVLFAFVLIPISGMLNFIVNWKYWLKIGALVGWIAIEWDRDLLRRLVAGRALPADPMTRPSGESLR